MRRHQYRYIHPLVAAASVSVLLVSFVGFAKLTGVLPQAATPQNTTTWAAITLPRPQSSSRAVAEVDAVSSAGDSGTAGDTASGAPTIAPAVPTEKSGLTSVQAPVSTPVATVPSIYVHVLDEVSRQRVSRLAPTLEKNGIALAGVKVVRATPTHSDLRYFRPGERAEALQVQATLAAIGLPQLNLKRIDGMEPLAKRRQYELWLSEG